MTSKHTYPTTTTRRGRLGGLPSFVSIETIAITALLALTFYTGGVAAQPTGGTGGSTAGWETILSNLYNVLYITLQYVGLAVLVLGFIVWFTARNNSQRSETGMKLTLGGGAMVIAYFGLGALVTLLEFIAG